MKGGGGGGGKKAGGGGGGKGGAVAAAKAAAVEDAEISKRLMEEDPMKRKLNITTSSKILACAILMSGFVALALHSALAAKTDAAATPQVKQKQFDTPQQAVDSLVQAAESFDVPVLKEILGPDSTDLVSSEDAVEDKNRAVAFVAKAKEKNSVAADPKNPNRTILTVGNDDFPFPIPIMKNKGKWYFDTKAGRQEILNRRIGANELDAIAICRGFGEAQHEYAQEKHDDSKVNQYAQRIISTPGKHEGLRGRTRMERGEVRLEKKSPKRWSKVTRSGLSLITVTISRC